MLTSGTCRCPGLPCLVFCGALIVAFGCTPDEPASQNTVDRPAVVAQPQPVASPDEATRDATEIFPPPLDISAPPLPAEPAADDDRSSSPVAGDGANTDWDPRAAPQQRRNPLRNPLREGSAQSRPIAVEPIPPAENSKTTAAELPPSTTPKPFAGGKHSGEPFDPIKENGTIFDDWPKPKLALVISGRQDGYIEPCGCAGLNRMKGGLSRRHSMFNQLRADGWTLVGLDVGGLVKGFGRQAELKFQTTVEAMRQMGYDAIALGKNDLRFPAAELLSVVASLPEVPSPFVSANAAVFGFDAGLTSKFRIIEAAGIKIGVTSILGTTWQAEINNAEIELADAREKLTELLPQLEARCDLLILLAHATKEESVELARAFPQFDVVVTGGGAPSPPAKPEVIEGLKPLLIEVGEKGMDVVLLGMFDDPAQPFRYQRVPLDSRFPESAEMKLLMAQYQDQLRRDGFELLGIREVPYPRKELLGGFVGSKKCGSCHEPAYDVWKKTGHAKAWETLKQADPPRNFDPECISCHVVGWHPTKYFPYETGYRSEDQTPERIDVGCENCHGPGGNHVKAEMGADRELQQRLQQAMVLTKEQVRKSKLHWCLNCHDLDNSPDFDFDTYWPQIEHQEDY